MINKRQFDILTYLEEDRSGPSQRQIAENTSMSVGSVNKSINELAEKGFVDKGFITEKGLEVLEPYRVKRAIFIAAGFGSRLVPISLNTPKPLIRVNGKRMIDSLLDAVIGAGIKEIYIVRGYLSEQFDQLLYKYPNIKFIENPIYNESNNISSILCASYLLKNSYVLEADLLLYNPKVIKKYQYASNYLGVYTDRTDDWCFHVENGLIKEVAIGGRNCYHMFGISYWTEEDGARLVDHIKDVYQAPGGKERYWDHVPLKYHVNEYDVHIRECSFNDLIEIDTFTELKSLDKTYAI